MLKASKALRLPTTSARHSGGTVSAKRALKEIASKVPGIDMNKVIRTSVQIFPEPIKRTGRRI